MTQRANLVRELESTDRAWYSIGAVVVPACDQNVIVGYIVSQSG